MVTNSKPVGTNVGTQPRAKKIRRGIHLEAVRQLWLNRWNRMPEPTAKEPVKNYITPSGLQRLRDELRFLLTRERPAVTQVVAWAAGNGDPSENADYQYGKRRLRQIDGRIRFLRNGLMPHASWTRKPQESGGRRRWSSSERQCATSTPLEQSGW